MTIGTVCSRDPVTAPANAPLAALARLMRDRHVGAIIVTRQPIDRPVPVGIVTDRDIVCAQIERGADLFTLNAEDVMTRDPLVLTETMSLTEGIERLRERGVRRAPVIDNSGGLIGLVSVDDLFAAAAEDLVQLARLLARQPKREGAQRHREA